MEHEQICANCRFWILNEEFTNGTTRAVVKGRGLCHFSPPAMAADPVTGERWPATHRDDWCGKWDAKQNAG